MFDVSIVNKRYFEIKLNVVVDGIEKEIVLEIEPPKLKALKKITSLRKAKEEESIDGLTEAIMMILRKNKSRYVVSSEVVDELDIDEMNAILTAYFEWLNKEKNSKN